jgi:Skp family chaperone for outer membrane proteins
MENDQSALDRIKCPNCGELFPVSEAIYHQIAERTREDLKAESIRQQKVFAAREKELKDKEESFETIVSERLKSATKAIEIEAENRARNALSLEMADLKRQASEKDARLNELQKTELEVLARKRELTSANCASCAERIFSCKSMTLWFKSASTRLTKIGAGMEGTKRWN